MGWRTGIILAWLAAVTPACAQCRARLIEWRGWGEAVEITNAETRLVVVPAVGRILHYGWADGPNLLWTDPALDGVTLPEGGRRNGDGQRQWVNFGGDKLWPNQQQDWTALYGADWPPDPWFDGAPHTCRLLPDGVELTGPVSPVIGARAVREIRLAASGSRVLLRQAIEKVQPAPPVNGSPLRYTAWTVTQVCPPDQVLFPVHPESALPNGYRPFAAFPVQPGNVAVEDGIGMLRPDPAASQKIGADSDGWLAAIIGDTVLGIRFRREAAQDYPDEGMSIEVYTSPAYTELETLSPWRPLDTGARLQNTLTWELHRLPASAGSPDERRRLAAEWLREPSS